MLGRIFTCSYITSALYKEAGGVCLLAVIVKLIFSCEGKEIQKFLLEIFANTRRFMSIY